MSVVVATGRGRVEGSVPPPDEKPDCEEHDQRGDRGLGSTLDVLREIALGDEDRDAEDHECHGVPEPPPRAQARGGGGRALASGGDQRRDGRDVVGIGGVPEAEQHGGEQDDTERGSLGQPRHPLVDPEHRAAPLDR